MKAKAYRLGELCRFVKGLSPTLKTPPGEFPLVVTAEYRRTANSWQIEGPAVCIPLVSSTGHGDAALHRVHYQEGKFALANLLVALLPKDSLICDAKYLYYLLTAKKDDLLVPLMLGTANVSLKEKDIAGVEVLLPPLVEQRRIVARIKELINQINEAKALSQQSRDDATALFPSLLSEVLLGASVTAKVTVKKSAAALLHENAKRYAASMPKNNNAHPGQPVILPEGPRPLPENWAWTTLGSILSVLVDCVNDTPDFAQENTGLLGLKSTNIRPYKLDLSRKWFVTPEDFFSWNRRETPRPGDTLFSLAKPRWGFLASCLKGFRRV